MAAYRSAVPDRPRLKRAADPTPTEIRVDTERLDVAFSQRPAMVDNGRSVGVSTDHLNEEPEEADAVGASERSEDVGLQGGSKLPLQISVLVQNGGRKFHDLGEARMPR